MDMAVLGDLLAREKRRSQPAVEFPAVDRAMSYHDFITTAYKSGNVLRYLGLGRGARLAVEPAVRPEPLLAFFGAAQLGASTTFDPAREARVRLVAADSEADYTDTAGRLAVFGGSPDSAATTHWEKAAWSENPAFPPTEVDPDSTVLVDGDDQYSHRQLLGMAEQIVDELDLTEGSRLAVRTPLAQAETAAGLAAALLAGSTAVFVEDATYAVDADAALVADSEQSTPEPARLDAGSLVD